MVLHTVMSACIRMRNAQWYIEPLEFCAQKMPQKHGRSVNMQSNKGNFRLVATANVAISLLVFMFMLRFPIAVSSDVEDQAPVPSGPYWVYPAFTSFVGLSYSHFWNKTARKHAQGLAQSLCQYAVSLFLSSSFVFVLIVVFGAPIFELVDRTILLALAVCSLTIAPLSVTAETVSPKELLHCIQTSHVRKSDKPGLTAHLSCLFTFAGTWLGSLLIPLDWDRPWQVCSACTAYARLFRQCLPKNGVLTWAKYHCKLHQSAQTIPFGSSLPQWSSPSYTVFTFRNSVTLNCGKCYLHIAILMLCLYYDIWQHRTHAHTNRYGQCQICTELCVVISWEQSPIYCFVLLM